MIRLLLFFLALLSSTWSYAWWNKDWAARTQITLDTSASGADLKTEVANLPVLVRLHTGNFDFLAARTDGADLRFIAEDGKTPLKFHLEKFDAVNQIGLAWVQLPRLLPANKAQHVFVYYGNENAAAASDANGTYDVPMAGVWHFAETAGAPQDATAYANNAQDFTGAQTFSGERVAPGARIPAAAIGAGLSFDGQTLLTIPASPSLKTGAGGYTLSFWVRPAADGQTATLLRQQDGGASIALVVEGGMLAAVVNGGTGEARTAPTVGLAAGAWQHVAVTLADKTVLYVNGQRVAEAAAPAAPVAGAISVGRDFRGDFDELQIAGVARSADWIKGAALSQGAEAELTVFGDEERAEGGGDSYFGVILQNVTLDGWIVIVICAVMFAISVQVMATKALVIGKTDRANQAFLSTFREVGQGDAAEVADTGGSEPPQRGFVAAMSGEQTRFENSSLYRIYRAGMKELDNRFGTSGRGELSPQALGAIKATLDGTLVRESQKLNSLMVLLTIAISGGPFLGLLGTVVGVMITFGAIAATGDVNIAAIAPGIAAALVATVAGLAVAIPALFGYNYLGSRLKAINADMHVFVDEFVARLAERYCR